MRTSLIVAILLTSPQFSLANSSRDEDRLTVNTNKQEPAAEHRQTEQPPISVIIAAMPKPSAEEKAEKAQERKEKGDSDDRLVWLTGILAFATVGLAIATAFLWYATRRLVHSAEQTAERQLRAYVSIENATINDVSSGSMPVAQLQVKNFGKTPAYEVTGTGGIAIGHSFDTLPPPTPTKTGQTRSSLSIGAITAQFHTLPVPLTPEMLNGLTAGVLTLWVYGEMQYRDAFGHRRTTKYRFQIGGDAGIRGNQLAICEEGNEET